MHHLIATTISSLTRFGSLLRGIIKERRKRSNKLRLRCFTHSWLWMGFNHSNQCLNYSNLIWCLVDLEKTFYRVFHNQVIEALADMHVPGRLLVLLVSYLTDRSMYMRYNGASSSIKLLPGSSRQGAFLGILRFITVFNGALWKPATTSSILMTWVG